MFYSLIIISKPSFRLSNIMNYVSDLYYTVYVPVLRRLTIEVSLKKFYLPLIISGAIQQTVPTLLDLFRLFLVSYVA